MSQQPGRRLVLCRIEQLDSARALTTHDDLLLAIDGKVGGAWSELEGAREVIRFGVPPSAASRFFSLAVGPTQTHTALSQAIERIVYARGIRCIKVMAPELMAAAVRGTGVYQGLVRIDDDAPRAGAACSAGVVQ